MMSSLSKFLLCGWFLNVHSTLYMFLDPVNKLLPLFLRDYNGMTPNVVTGHLCFLQL